MPFLLTINILANHSYILITKIFREWNFRGLLPLHLLMNNFERLISLSLSTFKKLWSNLRTPSEKSNSLHFKPRPSCCTSSKAFEVSRQTALNSIPISKDDWCELIYTRISRFKFWLVFETKSLSLKRSNILLNITRSKAFPQI